MIAFDTSLLVRFLADDDKAQADIAEALMCTNTVFIAERTLQPDARIDVFQNLGVFHHDSAVDQPLSENHFLFMPKSFAVINQAYTLWRNAIEVTFQ